MHRGGGEIFCGTTDCTGADAAPTGHIDLRIAGGAAGSSMDGEIAEVLIYTRGLNGEERQRVECYLSKRYKLPVSHGCPEFYFG